MSIARSARRAQAQKQKRAEKDHAKTRRREGYMREFTIPTPDTVHLKIGSSRIDKDGGVTEVTKEFSYFDFLNDNIFTYSEAMGKKPINTARILKTVPLFEGKKAGDKVLVEDDMAARMDKAAQQDWNQFLAKQFFHFIQATMFYNEKEDGDKPENLIGSREVKVQKAEDKPEPKPETPSTPPPTN